MTHHKNFPLSSWFDCDVFVDIVVSLIAHHNLGDNCRSYTLNKHINGSDNLIYFWMKGKQAYKCSLFCNVFSSSVLNLYWHNWPNTASLL